MSDRTRDIKRAQKESLLLKEVSKLFMQASLDDPQLSQVFINRVELSPDRSHCSIYFYTPKGPAFFKEILERLKLYKPSLRASLAKTIQSRYVPDLIFKFDEKFEKQQKIEALLEKIKEEGEI